MKEIAKFSLTLFLICTASAFLLGAVNSLTNKKIEAQKQTEMSSGLKEVVPEAEEFEPVIKNQEVLYYRAKGSSGKTIAYAFLACGKGYSSTIETLVGMTGEGVITNIKIISQNETPGLGTRIAEAEQAETSGKSLASKNKAVPSKKPWFQGQFSRKEITKLSDSVDSITGATISSNAVIDSVKEAGLKILEYIKAKGEAK